MEHTPDWFDLNDWMVLHHPTIYAATKYLSDMSAQRRIWLTHWEACGKPEISEETL